MGNTVGSLSGVQRDIVIGSLLGDGGMRCKTNARSAVYLNTQKFDEGSQERLLGLLLDQWGLQGSLNRDKTYYRIRLSVESSARFRSLVGPHLLSELRYKLPHVTP